MSCRLPGRLVGALVALLLALLGLNTVALAAAPGAHAADAPTPPSSSGSEQTPKSAEAPGVAVQRAQHAAIVKAMATHEPVPAPGLVPGVDADNVIEGVVRDGGGHALDGVDVEAVPAASPNSDPAASAQTYEVEGLTAHGGYVLNVPDGSYIVRFRSETDADIDYQTVYYGGGSGSSVTVSGAQTTVLDDVTVFPVEGVSVTGTLVDENGKPLADQWVDLERKYADGWGYYDEVDTDASGTYTFTDVAPDHVYTVDTYEKTQDEDAEVYLGGAPSAELATTFTPAAAVTTTVVPLALAPLVEVSGTVTASDGSSPEDAAVQVYAVGPDGALSQAGGSWLGEYESGDDSYRIPVIPGYSYTVGVEDYGTAPVVGTTYLGNTGDASKATHVAVTADQAFGAITLGKNTSVVTVHVVDTDGDPVPGADLSVYEKDTDGDWIYAGDLGRQTTNGDWSGRLPWGGTYTIGAETNDDYYLGDGTSLTGAKTLAATSAQPSIDAGTITIPAGPKVKGTIRGGNGQPAANADVELYGCQLSCDDGDYLGETQTDAQGHYVVDLSWYDDEDYSNVTVGVWDDSDYSSGDVYPGGTTDLADATVYPFPTLGNPTTIDLALSYPARTLLGQVTYPDDLTDIDKTDVRAELYKWNGTMWSDGTGLCDCESPIRSQTVKPDGSYQFDDLDPGTYAVEIVGDNHAGTSQLYDMWSGPGGKKPANDGAVGAFPVTDDTTTVSAPTITFGYGPGTLVGTLDVPSGAAFTGNEYVDLQAYRWDEENQNWTSADIANYGYSYVYPQAGDTSVSYAFSGLTDGDYAVEATVSADNGDAEYLQTWTTGGYAQPTGDDAAGIATVATDTNPTHAPDINLDAGRTVTGTVTAADGTPLPGSWVDAYPADYSVWFGAGVHADGSFLLRVPQNTALSLEVGHQDFDPVIDGAIAAGTASLTKNITLTPEWGLIGTKGGQQSTSCLVNSGGAAGEPNWGNGISYNGHELSFIDGALTDSTYGDLGDGIWGQMPADDGWPATDALNRDPSLRLLPAGTAYDRWTWGTSADGKTLCVQANAEAGIDDDSAVAQLILTTKADGSVTVRYGYDAVPASAEGATVGYDAADATPAHTGVLAVDQPTSDTFAFPAFAQLADAPTDLTRPAISGTPQVGMKLTATPGTWSSTGSNAADTGVETAIRWTRKGGAALGFGPTLTVPAGLQGTKVVAHVRAWKAGHAYTFAAVKQKIAPNPAAVNTALPVITGDAAVGGTLGADTGSWTATAGAGDLAYTYQWMRGTKAIADATDASYAPTAADAGKQLSVVVTASSQGASFSAVAATSAAVAVAALPTVPSTAGPSLAGAAQVGTALTLSPGSWDSGADVSVRWQVDGRNRDADAGSNGLSLTPLPGDKGSFVTARETVTEDGYQSVAWSKTLGPIVGASVTTKQLTVTVTDPLGHPVIGAWVDLCNETDWSCIYNDDQKTDADGTYIATVSAGSTYDVSVTGPTGFHDGEAEYAVPTSGTAAVALTLIKSTPPPANVSIPSSNGTNDGEPSLDWTKSQTFTVTGCATTATPTYTVTFEDGRPSLSGALTAAADADHDGITTFSASVPAFYPAHGEAVFGTDVPADCKAGTAPTTVAVYIDPSGTVIDQYGAPVQGATVTLLRSDTVDGTFVAVPDGSDIMSEDNRQNPDTTDTNGGFAWDVIDGYYEVRADKEGCASAQTPAMPVPPAQLDLVLQLDCPGDSGPRPSGTVVVTGTGVVGTALTTDDSAWSSGLTVADQWYAGDTPIAGATGTSYTVGATDVGKAITVRQSATRMVPRQQAGAPQVTAKAGQAVSSNGITATAADTSTGGTTTGGTTTGGTTTGGTTTGGTTTVSSGPKPAAASVASKVTLKVKPKKPSHARKAKLVVKVTAAGKVVSGTVTIRIKKKVIGTVVLRGGKGTLKVKLPKGKKKLLLSYAGASGIRASHGKLKVTVK